MHKATATAFRQDKRARILDAAVKVFAGRGFHSATVAEIARVAGVADGTIYLYFKSKDDLLLRLFDEKMTDLLAQLRAALAEEKSAPARLRRFIQLHLSLVERNPDLAAVLIVELRQSAQFIKAADRAKLAAYVVVASIGSGEAQAEIRSALAMGADRGILVKHDGFVDSDGVARLLAKLGEKEKPDLVLMGKQAVDVDDNVTGQLLAEYLSWGQATFASKKESLESAEERAKKPGLMLAADKKSMKVVREVDGGVETLEMQLPGMVTVDLRLNIPRYASLPNIMKAKKKPIEELAPAGLGVDVAPKVKVIKVEAPPARAAGIKVPDVLTLVQKLHDEAKAI